MTNTGINVFIELSRKLHRSKIYKEKALQQNEA
jgi:hypothetical protein